jgi:hypothetical protein
MTPLLSDFPQASSRVRPKSYVFKDQTIGSNFRQTPWSANHENKEIAYWATTTLTALETLGGGVIDLIV